MPGAPSPERYLPFDPLLQILRTWRHEPFEITDDGDSWRPSDRRIGELTGIGLGMVQRYRTQGRLDVMIADKMAIRLGLHPCHIWGDAYWAVPISKGLLYESSASSKVYSAKRSSTKDAARSAA